MFVYRILPGLSLIAIGAVVCLTAAGQQARPRFFTDQTGKFRVRAEVVDLNETHVKLKKVDGDEVTLPIDRLSDQDQEFLRNAYRSYKQMAGDFPIGTKVEIATRSRWYPGVVQKVQEGKFFVDYDGFSERWNEWVTADRLRLPQSEADGGATPTAPAEDPRLDVRPSVNSPGSSAPAMSPENDTEGSRDGAINASAVPQLSLENLSDRPVDFIQKSISTRRFTTASGASNWKVPAARFAEMQPLPEVTIALPGKTRPRYEGFWPSANGRHALLMRDQELYALNLVTGDVEWGVSSLPNTKEWKLHPLAISDDGSRLAFAVTNQRDEPRGVVAYAVEGLQAQGIWQWRLVPDSHNAPPVRAAYWLSDDRLGVVDEDEFTVWNPDAQSAHAIVRLDAGTLPQWSPGAPMIGMLWMGRLALYRTDTMQPVAFSGHLPRGSRWVSFRSDGKEILISGAEEAAVITTATGEIQTIENVTLTNARAESLGGDRWLIDGEKVYDRRENEIDWTIVSSSATGGQGFATVLGSQVAIADPVGARFLMRDPSELIGAVETDSAAAKGMAVSPGSKVAIRLVGNQVERFRDQVDASVRALIQRNGWVLDPSSSTVLEVHANLQDQSVAYEILGLTGKRTETVNVPVYRFEIRVVQGTKILDARGWSSLPKSIGKVPRGKTLAQHVKSLSQPQPERLAKLSLPASIEKPKSNRGGRGATEVWSLP